MERKLIIGNLGDSRAYLISARSIRQLTVDHSYVEILLKAGSIGAEEARRIRGATKLQKHSESGIIHRQISLNMNIKQAIS